MQVKRNLQGLCLKTLLAALPLFLLYTANCSLHAQTASSQEESSSLSTNSADDNFTAISAEDSGHGPNAGEQPAYESPQASAALVGAAPTREGGLFRSWRIDLTANTLGAGFDLSTPLARHFDVRGGGNIIAFGYEFDVDGLHYDSDIRLRSGNLRLDWFPRHRNFHISPGILYANNNVTALSHVPPGASFDLGDESFVNSVDDPVHGDARLIFPRRVSPMVTFGFRNLLPGRHEHISVPVEFGVAYTGAPKIDVTLVGSACAQDGCFSFADNAEAQQSLRDEIKDINDTLSSIPVYPVLSIGFGYRF
jgi:hypothetical protein